MVEFRDAITDDDNGEAARVATISMLTVDALAAIRRGAMRTSGPVIEFGTYVGGTGSLRLAFENVFSAIGRWVRIVRSREIQVVAPDAIGTGSGIPNLVV